MLASDPQEVPFCLRQRLTIEGIVSDSIWPEPLTNADDTGGDDDAAWAMVPGEAEEQDGVESPVFADGSWGENAPKFEPEPIGMMEAMALQPDVKDIADDEEEVDVLQHIDGPIEPDPQQHFPALNAGHQRQIEHTST